MLMPENFEIRDNGVLVIFVNEVEYEFVEKDDFIYSDKKKIILKHHAVINLANNAKIKVGAAGAAKQSRLRQFCFLP